MTAASCCYLFFLHDLNDSGKQLVQLCVLFEDNMSTALLFQVQICKRNVEVMDAVRRGAQLAIDECQFQFRNRRWNCSTLETMPVFGKVVTQGRVIYCYKSFYIYVL